MHKAKQYFFQLFLTFEENYKNKIYLQIWFQSFVIKVSYCLLGFWQGCGRDHWWKVSPSNTPEVVAFSPWIIVSWCLQNTVVSFKWKGDEYIDYYFYRGKQNRTPRGAVTKSNKSNLYSLRSVFFIFVDFRPPYLSCLTIFKLQRPIVLGSFLTPYYLKIGCH